MAYVGKFNHQLDQKNRMRIPYRLKAVLGSEYVVMRGSRGCLFIYSAEEFETRYLSKVDSISISDDLENDALIGLVSTAVFPEEDNQGRFVLDANLRRLAKIDKNVVFVGALNRIELWAEEEYNKRYGEVSDKEFNDSLKNLKQYGI